jgi:hypothetical protein
MTPWFWAQSPYVCRVQSSVWRLPKYWPPTPSRPSECVLPPSPPKERWVLTRRAVRGWGSIFWKTPDIGLASYSMIPLRFQDKLLGEAHVVEQWIVQDFLMPLDRLDQTIKFRQQENITNTCLFSTLMDLVKRQNSIFLYKMNNIRSK